MEKEKRQTCAYNVQIFLKSVQKALTFDFPCLTYYFTFHNLLLQVTQLY